MDNITNDLELGKQLMAANYPQLQITGIEVIQGEGLRRFGK
ncbi:hypothetical protein ACI2OX_06530 [Bacillus sp. N9]